MEHPFVNICDEQFTIKEELLDVTDRQQTDSAQHRLESTLESKHYEVNTDLQMQRELLINKYENSERDDKNVTIKSEIIDITKQLEEADLQVLKPIIVVKENKNDDKGTIDDVSKACETFGDEHPAVHNKDEEACEAVKQEWKDLSVTPLSYWSNGLLFKELTVVLEDGKLNLGKQNTQECFGEATNNYVSSVKAQSVIHNEIGTHSTINKGSCQKNTNKKFNAGTNSVNSDIDFIHYDAESSKNTFICDICNKSYQNKISLYQHMQRHLNLFNCTYCSYTGHDKGNLNKHINTKHTKNTVYNCSYCGYSTHNKGNLNRHVNSKHIKNIVHNCSYCSYSTYDTSALSSHVNTKHTKNTVYNCSYCSYRTCIKSTLSSHENVKHTMNTVYNCSHCSYSTYNRSTFSRHINIKHGKNTVHNCSYCSYRTYDKSSLSGHVNSKHTQETVYNCSYCDYKTFHKSGLNYHVNALHTKINVFYCSHCDHKTYHKNTLARHIKAKHDS